jgi:hypothetical protein
VRDRVGIDRRPVDVTTDHGAHLLEAFVWADQADRLDRLSKAIAIARVDPPRLMQGDYVEVLPPVLAERDLGALTVVYHSASTMYLSNEQRRSLDVAIAQEGKRGSLARVTFEPTGEVTYEGFALEEQVWPGDGLQRLARVAPHGGSLEWVA